MAYDPIIADIFRTELAGLPVAEKKMFGGLIFMLHGNMMCGAMSHGALFRVGTANYAAAMALEGVSCMQMKGREMKGYVTIDAGGLDDVALRRPLMDMALEYVNSLPPK